MTNKNSKACPTEGAGKAIVVVNAPRGLCRDSSNPNYPWDHSLGNGNAHRIKAYACSPLLCPEVFWLRNEHSQHIEFLLFS